jgi:hypothetical protein
MFVAIVLVAPTPFFKGGDNVGATARGKSTRRGTFA